MKKSFTFLLVLCTISLYVLGQGDTQSTQNSISEYQPCNECFKQIPSLQTPSLDVPFHDQFLDNDEYQSSSQNSVQYTSLTNLNDNYNDNEEIKDIRSRALRIAVGLVSFVIIVAILPRHDRPYIQ